jgi:plastocyanin
MRRLSVAAVMCGLLAAVAVAPGLAAGQRSVAVKDDFFSPAKLSVAKGTTVVWTWRGEGRHNVVMAQGPVAFRSKIKRKGSYQHKFGRTGRYELVCTVHPGMNMTVRVTRPG